VIPATFETWAMRGLIGGLILLVFALLAHIWANHNREDKQRLSKAESDIAALKTQEARTGQVIVRLETTLDRLEKEFTGLRTSVDQVNQTLGKLLAAVAGSTSLGRRPADLMAREDGPPR
jgi:septal ring factor EnvC (AmiA/AmiB activator)